ncbi:hypothetical protein INT47_002415 [Mucor saturninus]|uniref:Uncharacterized protein n=1 Tax=Mucor saturninus TaxID=64648 RepID=A0A8H7VBJ4_9FUNG|nr:hypothetical protein INT47_002415 [Mucor saturninus]
MSMNIQPYCPIPVTVAVSIETYKTVIQESDSQHGPTCVCREYYVSHGSGSKREYVGIVRGSASVQVRGLQKRSKKIKCPAALKVVCLPG